MDFTVLNAFIAYLAIYAFSSLAGLISERSGTVNIGLEGNMIIGGLIWSVLLTSSPELFQNTSNLGAAGPIIAMFLAALIGSLYSTIFSFATINFLGNHIIVGTAMNMIAPALSFIITTALFGKTSVDIQNSFYWWSGVPGGSLNLTLIICVGIAVFALALIWVILQKTSFGLRLKTSGENPYLLEVSGVSIKLTRWIANYIVGFLSCFSGAISMAIFTQFSGTVQGMGYIAIAILILGQWKVVGITLGTIIMSVVFACFQWINFGNFPSEILKMIPFILPIVVLIFIKISSKEKVSTRLYDYIYTSSKQQKNKSLVKKVNFWFWFPFIYTSYWVYWGIPFVIAMIINKEENLKKYIKDDKSYFSTSPAPEYLGDNFIKGTR